MSVLGREVRRFFRPEVAGQVFRTHGIGKQGAWSPQSSEGRFVDFNRSRGPGSDRRVKLNVRVRRLTGVGLLQTVPIRYGH